MIQPMTALEIRSVVSQMQELVGKRIEKIKKVNDDVYELQLGGSWLLIDLHFGAFLGPAYDWKDDGWSSSVTQMLKDKRIDKIEQAGLDRIIRIDAGEISLVIELFGGGNIILLKEGVIHRVLKPREWRGRRLIPGNDYKYPETLVKMPETEEEFMKAQPSILVGKKYASQCSGWKEFLKLLDLASNGKGEIADENYRIGGKKDISRIIYEFYTKIVPKMWEKDKLEKIKGTVEKQKKIIEEFEKKAIEYREKGKYIYDHMVDVDSILELIKSGKWPAGVNIKRRSRYMVTLEI